jgi:hypothetical protein
MRGSKLFIHEIILGDWSFLMICDMINAITEFWLGYMQLYIGLLWTGPWFILINDRVLIDFERV